VNSTAGIVAGFKYRLRPTSGHDEELVHVDTIQAGVSVTARDNLQYTYASGDIFRSRDYFPVVVAVDEASPVMEMPGLTYALDHQMREDRG